MVGFRVDHVEPGIPRPFIGAYVGGMIQFEQKEGGEPSKQLTRRLGQFGTRLG